MKKEKFILPISIVIAAIIFGSIFYAIQVKKQESIEKQQLIKILGERKDAEEKAEQEKEEKIFSNNLKCQGLLKELKQRWYNVVGIYYDEFLNTCIVKYTKNGEVEESPLEDMQDD